MLLLMQVVIMFLNLLICCHMMHNFIFLSYYILFIIIKPNAQLSPNRRHVDMSTQIFELDLTQRIPKKEYNVDCMYMKTCEPQLLNLSS
jgi:hypothetical protein